MMTREDRLNVLELLPVWQLNVPHRHAIPALPQQALVENKGHEVAPSVRQCVSEDGNFTFLLEDFSTHAHHQEAEILLRNIFKAMRVTCGAETSLESTLALFESTSQLLVIMGERVANQILKQSYDVAQWRDLQSSQVFQYHTTPVIVTYAPAHLLFHRADKAKVWADLCLAKIIVSGS
ncbi:MAG: hypothetical protein HOP21_10625 [Methylotenera sp.]|nr:hypothetical protein [Methylotenera sp.]